MTIENEDFKRLSLFASRPRTDFPIVPFQNKYINQIEEIKK